MEFKIKNHGALISLIKENSSGEEDIIILGIQRPMSKATEILPEKNKTERFFLLSVRTASQFFIT